MRNGGFLLHSTLSNYLVIMELRFDMILYSKWSDENYHAGHIQCSWGPHSDGGPQVSHPYFKQCIMHRYVPSFDKII